MLYVIPALTLGMLAYMVWLVAFRLRRDRVARERALTRGRRAFRPRERLRFLLHRAFHVPPAPPDWEDPLVSRLAEAKAAEEPVAREPASRGAFSEEAPQGQPALALGVEREGVGGAGRGKVDQG